MSKIAFDYVKMGTAPRMRNCGLPSGYLLPPIAAAKSCSFKSGQRGVSGTCKYPGKWNHARLARSQSLRAYATKHSFFFLLSFLFLLT
jgi:hypothetical protein